MDVKVQKRKKPASKSDNPPHRPKTSPEQKLIRSIGKTKALVACFDAFFNSDINVYDQAKDLEKTPAERGFAQMAVNFAETGDLKIGELVHGVFGNATKAKEIDHSASDGTYKDFLKELSKRNAG